MPYEIETKDGIVIRGIPDDVRPDDPSIKSKVEAARSTQGATPSQQLQSSLPMRVIQGMRDPIDAGAQLISRAVPSVVNDVMDYIPSKMRASSNPVISGFANAYLADPRPAAIDKNIRDTEQQYQSARTATAPATLETLVTGKRDPGMDLARLAGNITSPANALIAKAIPAAAMSTVPRMAATGAAMGATGAALTPVADEKSQKDFLETKASQVGTGAVVGAVATPILGKVLQAAAPYVERIVNRVAGQSETTRIAAALETDNVIAKALKDVGQTIQDIPKQQYEALRKQVNDALKSGVKLDAAALLRKSDFKAAGMESTLGQITRDPTQYAREINLRGVAGVGDPLMARFHGQNQQLQEQIGGFAKGASDKVTAGERLASALSAKDAQMKGNVNQAYNAARDSLGRAAPMDSAEFSRVANLALDDGMLGHYLPAEVRNILNGVTSGKIPFTVNTAVQMDSVLSAAQRSAGQGSPQALAISKVRDALNSAPIESAVGADAKKMFDAARGLAKERFSLHDAIPALKAAANGEIAADDFVRKFVINAPAKEVKRMADMLDGAAKQEAKAQLGATIQRAAFGENLAGDKAIAPERLAKALRDIGAQKLEAFFSAGEIEQMNRLARIAAYKSSMPSTAAVNTSNTAAAAVNLASQLPGGDKLRLLAGVTQPIVNQRAVNTAMNATVPQSANVSPEAIRRAQLAAALGGLVTGGVSGSAFR